MTDFPQIVVGTYEEFVLGYKPRFDGESKIKCTFEQTFATHSHQASLRCTAANERYMASSGADEYINIYNMDAMKVSKVINYHDSTVTCLEFTPDKTHLVTANQNGDIAIFRCRDWTLVKLWKEAHKHANGVTSMSIHPTGSLLLTTGADNVVRFWNLIKGRQAYASNFTKSCSVGCSLNFALWSTTGKYYVVCIGKQMEVYKTDTAAIIYKIISNSKITCASFCKKNLLCLGSEEGMLEIHSVIQKKLLFSIEAHKSRLKCMSSLTRVLTADNEEKTESYLVTADSKGIIKLWSLKKKGPKITLKVKAEVNCDCRITCLCIVYPKSVKEEKQNNQSLNCHNEIEDITHVDEETTVNDDVNVSVREDQLKMKKEKRKQKGNSNEKLMTKTSTQSALLSSKKKFENNNARSEKNKKRTFTESTVSDDINNKNSKSSKLVKNKKLKHSNSMNLKGLN